MSPPRSASTSSSSLERCPPPANSSRRRPRRNRLSAKGSAPPSADDSSISARSTSSSSGLGASFSTASSGRTAGCLASGSSSVAEPIGTPAARKARCSTRKVRAGERTSTAISDHGTPSIRCARRSWSAIQLASAAGVGITRTRTWPSSSTFGETSLRCGERPGKVAPILATAVRTAGASRCAVVSVTVRAPSGSASAKRLASAPRKEKTF